jgi:hypothetical protein
MKSAPDRFGNVVVIPSDPDFGWILLLVALCALVTGCLLSGAPLSALIAGPRACFRAVLDAASSQGKPFFWFIWAFFCVAMVTLVAAFLIAYANLRPAG